MKVLLYFDWSRGTRKELRDWVSNIEKASEESGVEYMGLYGSMNKQWNYCAIFDTTNYDDFLTMALKVPRPKYMTHYITELLIASTIS